MMPSRSTPNLHQTNPATAYTTTAYHRLSQKPVLPSGGERNDDSPPPAPPVRDSSSLKSIKYGPGHEKFPSWPVPAAAEGLPRTNPGGGSTRSKSWTDHTNYPKEKVVAYTRPYMKRQHSQYQQQKLKTVMERCEKIPAEAFESRHQEKISDRLYLPNVDHDGKPLGDADYTVPSPPERDFSKPQLTQKDLEEYARSYQDPVKYTYPGSKEGNHRLTESGLEEFMEYNRSYEESLFTTIDAKHEDNMLTQIHHQKQVSYAQSEGYHSYVSSTDSTSTPFLDRLRRDSEAVVSRPHSSSTWENESSCSRREGRDSVVTTSSGSASSSETLKWHGSMSDVSVASSSCTHLANQSNASSRQLIAHSARVQTPQRHHSESVLYMSGQGDAQQGGKEGWTEKESRNNSVNKLKLFPVNTYTVQESNGERPQENGSGVNNSSKNRLSLSLQSALSVADRISELEKQQKYSYLDPNKKHKVPDPTLKAIQKKALLSFYERHQQNSNNNKNAWRSEPQLARNQQQQPLAVPKPPSPKVKVSLPSRRASSASDYASGNNSKRSSFASLESKTTDHIGTGKTTPRHQHSNSCGSLSTDLIGPFIVGPSISVDDYVPDKPPERPPKNPNLRTAFPDLFQEQRVPSPDLPPPSPPTVLENEVFDNDDPLPPPPPECDTDWQEQFNDRLKGSTTSRHQIPQPQVQKSHPDHRKTSLNQNVGIPERSMRYSLIKTKSTDHIIQQVSSKPYQSLPPETKPMKPETLGFPNQRGYAERSSARYPSTQKLVLNGSIAVSQKVNGLADQHRPEPLKPIHRDGFKKQPSSPTGKEENHRVQRASIAESSLKESPPPLQPRHMRVNQSMRAKMPHDHRTRMSPPKDSMREGRSSSLSQSKASYLASRRDRELIVSESETGSYKRTMSPNGHAISPEVAPEPQRANSRETVWPLIRPSRDLVKNNNNIMRRPSMNEKQKKSMSFQGEKFDKKDESIRKSNPVLPDVLPVNAKMIPRSPQQQYNRPTHLSFSSVNGEGVIKKSPLKSPPSSPPKSPSRSSPFAPLRSTALSSPPFIETSDPSSPIRFGSSPPITSTPTSKSLGATCANTTKTSPQFVPRDPPHIKASLSPAGSPIKLSPLRNSPPNSSCIVAATPFQISNKSSQSYPVISSSPKSSPKASPKLVEFSPPRSLSPKPEDYPTVIEGLQMIQRTEVVLRVNTTTSDASSQTEKEELPPTPLPVRKKLQEEIDCEKLSQDFVNHLPTSDRLKDLLVPGPEHKKPTDYVQGLFKVDVTLRPRPANSPFRSRNNTPSSSPPPLSTSSTSSKTCVTKLSLPKTTSPPEPISPLSCSSVYFTTSEPKAKFLTRYSQDMNQCHAVKDTKDLSQKKEELVGRLDKKLEVLRSEALLVSDECRINEDLGINVENYINRVASPHEVSKFRLHVEEVGKITSLLLGLSGRLARAENALMNMDEEHPERGILESKRDKLLDQLEEAKKLKECIDKRSINVSNILYKYLNSEEYADYDHFINMKAKLIMDSKEINDKIKLGEEQLEALKETLIITD